MSEWIKNLAGAVLAAALAASVAVYSNTQTNTYVMEKLTTSTDKLGDAVTELRITVGAQNEKFVTKEELRLSLKELKQELKNGS